MHSRLLYSLLFGDKLGEVGGCNFDTFCHHHLVVSIRYLPRLLYRSKEIVVKRSSRLRVTIVAS